MPITVLNVHNFRNLSQVQIPASSGINLIYGQNGSGKTSLLETIYYLGLGRSFRTRLAEHIIKKDSDTLAVSAQIVLENQQHSIGIERRRDGHRRIHLNGEPVKSILPLAQLLPLQLMNTHSYRFFHDGKKTRRQFLDWGVFHVEQSFYSCWQRVEQLLKQRNAALKSGHSLRELSIWDAELCDLANRIDNYRKNYLTELIPMAQQLMQRLIGNIEFDIRYERGWDEEKDLATALHNNFYRDRKIGYTQLGPQRADLQVLVLNSPAQDHLSQGQQKLAAYALQIAQGTLLKEKVAISPIYLVDDLPSELDPDKRNKISKELLALNTQVFITGITLEDMQDLLSNQSANVFHVKHGQLISESDVSCAALV